MLYPVFSLKFLPSLSSSPPPHFNRLAFILIGLIWTIVLYKLFYSNGQEKCFYLPFLSWSYGTLDELQSQRKIKPFGLPFKFPFFLLCPCNTVTSYYIAWMRVLHINCKGNLYLNWEACLRSRLISPFSLTPKCICYRMKSTKSPSTWLYQHFGSQKFQSPGAQIIPLKTISMGITASFLSSSVQPNNKLRWMDCVYCFELEPLS